MMRWRILVTAGIALLAGFASVAAPALGQNAGEKVYRLGHLGLTEAGASATMRDALPAMEKLGFIAGRNLVFDARFGPPDRLPALAREILAANPDAIIAVGGDAMRAAADATRTIPIVIYGPDPVEYGIAQSLARPGRNITGIVILATELDGKRLDLLREAVPAARRIAALHRANSPNRQASEAHMRAISAAAGFELLNFEATGPDDYHAVFAAICKASAEALIVAADPGLFRDTERIVTLAREARLPTMCQWDSMARAGCFLSYGPNQAALRLRLGDYVARIFRGAAPADLPTEQPTKFELVVNLKTAKALGITLPPSILARADEVIE